ncbi:hypothetical protein D3C85_929240 [compost metagenome]
MTASNCRSSNSCTSSVGSAGSRSVPWVTINGCTSAVSGLSRFNAVFSIRSIRVTNRCWRGSLLPRSRTSTGRWRRRVRRLMRGTGHAGPARSGPRFCAVSPRAFATVRTNWPPSKCATTASHCRKHCGTSPTPPVASISMPGWPSSRINRVNSRSMCQMRASRHR